MTSLRVRAGDASKVLIGCLVAGVVCFAICAGTVVFTLPTIMDRAEKLISEAGGSVLKEVERTIFLEDWNPPAADSAPDALFPLQVGEFVRTAAPQPAVPEALGFDEPILHAEYRSTTTTVDVYLIQVDDDQRSTIFHQVRDAVIGEGHDLFEAQGTRSYRIFGHVDSNALWFNQTPPGQTGSLWWSKDWLALALNKGSEDPELFLKKFFVAIQPKSAEENAPAAPGEEGAAVENGAEESPEERPASTETAEQTSEETPEAPAVNEPAAAAAKDSQDN